MVALTLDCYSLSADIVANVEPYKFIQANTVRKNETLDKLEYYHGLKRGQSNGFLDSPFNLVQCRTDISKLFGERRVLIAPSAQAVQEVELLVKTNKKATLEKRQRLDEVYRLDSSQEFRIYSITFDDPIFVRDPTTNQVTRHDSPHTSLPPFVMSINPCFWAMRAQEFVRVKMGRSRRVPDDVAGPIVTLFMMYTSRVPLEFFYDDCSLGDFPERRLPYGSHELGVPDLSTTPSSGSKRSRSSFNSEQDTESEYDISDWREKAGNVEVVVPDDGVLEIYAQEPARPVDSVAFGGDEWRAVVLRKAEAMSDKRQRTLFTRLAKPPAQTQELPRRATKQSRR